MSKQPEYYLCSSTVVEHFPDLERSKPFKSGYSFDNAEYFVISTNNFEAIKKYYDEVIEPYNEKSNCPIIDFWLNECVHSQLDATKITLKQCKEIGLFRAIEREYNLTNERNRAHAIHSLAEKYRVTPIQFINKIAP